MVARRVMRSIKVDRLRRTEFRHVDPTKSIGQARKQISCDIATRSGHPAGTELWLGKFEILLFANQHLILSPVIASWSSIGQKDPKPNGANSSICLH
jgi:hypothetical protein